MIVNPQKYYKNVSDNSVKSDDNHTPSRTGISPRTLENNLSNMKKPKVDKANNIKTIKTNKVPNAKSGKHILNRNENSKGSQSPDDVPKQISKDSKNGKNGYFSKMPISLNPSNPKMAKSAATLEKYK